MVEIKGFSVSQNGQDFLVGTAKISELLQYTMYTERLIVGFDEEEKPIYSDTIQRQVENPRVEQIADFLINDETATFPTNIVLGVPLCAIEKQNVEGNLITLTFKQEVIDGIVKAKHNAKDFDIYVTIIDGQHRIRGIEVAIERLRKSKQSAEKLEQLLNMDVVISCFMDKSLEYHAMIFSTINRTQKRVSQDLVHSLFGLTENDSPYKTALEVCLALNGHHKSPFYRRIKLYGNDYDGSFVPPLSQSAMIKKIVSFISISQREAENDRFRKRSELRDYKGNRKLSFRKFYAEDCDSNISNSIFYFFSSVQNSFKNYWSYDSKSKPTNILQSTVGFDALMNLLNDILSSKEIELKRGAFDLFIQKFEDLQIGDTNMFPMTTRGKKIFYNSMFIKVFPNDESVKKKEQEIEELRSNVN